MPSSEKSEYLVIQRQLSFSVYVMFLNLARDYSFEMIGKPIEII